MPAGVLLCNKCEDYHYELLSVCAYFPVPVGCVSASRSLLRPFLPTLHTRWSLQLLVELLTGLFPKGVTNQIV